MKSLREIIEQRIGLQMPRTPSKEQIQAITRAYVADIQKRYKNRRK